jgi:hypothetical protein
VTELADAEVEVVVLGRELVGQFVTCINGGGVAVDVEEGLTPTQATSVPILLSIGTI